MRYPLTFLDDLMILLKVFQLPEEVLIYDPGEVIIENTIDDFQIIEQLTQKNILQFDKKVLVNLSNEKIIDEISNNFEFILDFKSNT